MTHITTLGALRVHFLQKSLLPNEKAHVRFLRGVPNSIVGAGRRAATHGRRASSALILFVFRIVKTVRAVNFSMDPSICVDTIQVGKPPISALIERIQFDAAAWDFPGLYVAAQRQSACKFGCRRSRGNR